MCSFNRTVPQHRTWSPEQPDHGHIRGINQSVYPGPWLLCFTTSAAQGAQRFCCRSPTAHSTWPQRLRQDPGPANHWLLSVPSVAVGFSTVPWQWRSWSAWRLPSWLEMWWRLRSLCKQGSREHHRDTWKVNIVKHIAHHLFMSRFYMRNVNLRWYAYCMYYTNYSHAVLQL